MNILRRARNRTRSSPSFDIPKLCLPAEESSTESVATAGTVGTYRKLDSDQTESLSSGDNQLQVQVGNRGRSSSFDTSTLRSGEAPNSDDHLLQPPNSGTFFDHAYSGSSEENVSDRDLYSSLKVLIPKYYRRRSMDIPRLCIHCVHLESLSSQETSPTSPVGKFNLDEDQVSSCFWSLSSSDDSEISEDGAESDDEGSGIIEVAQSARRHTCSNTGILVPPLRQARNDLKKSGDNVEEESYGSTLQVPLLKPRSSSMDASYRLLQDDERRSSLDMTLLSVPDKDRSASVDVTLPTKESDHYKATPSTSSKEKAISKSSQETMDLLHPSHAEYGYKKREIRSSVDWSECAMNGDHIWVDTNASGDACYVGDTECSKRGDRKKCSACKILIHTGCLPQLDRINFRCKPTFREAGPRNYREHTFMRHHWVHRRRQEGKCKQCGKSFQQRFTFQSKDIIAISCSWCKVAYHNKVSCFMMQQIEEQCTLGIHASIIIPPSWIIKLPKKGSFKSSLRKKKKVPTATLR